MQFNDQITKDRIALGDRAFFALHPGRECRVRYPSQGELRRVREHGKLPDLKPEQRFLVVVSKLPKGGFITSLIAARLSDPDTLPNSDAEIRAAMFNVKPSIVA